MLIRCSGTGALWRDRARGHVWSAGAGAALAIWGLCWCQCNCLYVAHERFSMCSCVTLGMCASSNIACSRLPGQCDLWQLDVPGMLWPAQKSWCRALGIHSAPYMQVTSTVSEGSNMKPTSGSQLRDSRLTFPISPSKPVHSTCPPLAWNGARMEGRNLLLLLVHYHLQCVIWEYTAKC